ncbi:MAG TPA: multicopper oxidase domain-containing protein, partial [Candidatus Dormibacteraeota bacterium]|nr:multicopper oxidase domain-containing protein [Candidatus Dormibacteraeota bacterium]
MALAGLAWAGIPAFGPGAAGQRASANSSADAQQDPGRPPAHDESEGFLLEAAKGESVRNGSSCAAHAPVRSYDVAAIGVDITLNRYLDHDPQGEMFVLEEDLAAVASEQARNAQARHASGNLVVPAATTGTATAGVEPAASIGLKDDVIQPLTLRVSRGDCLRIHLHNLLPRGEPVSLHLHGSALRVSDASTGPRPPSRGRIKENLPAVAANPAATAASGGTVAYEWMVGPNERLGTYYLHSHALERTQTDHGLFGAVVVEPAGSSWL